MKVKVNLMLALSHRCEALILDEPTSGLDPFSRNELLEIFSEFRHEGVAVFFRDPYHFRYREMRG